MATVPGDAGASGETAACSVAILVHVQQEPDKVPV